MVCVENLGLLRFSLNKLLEHQKMSMNYKRRRFNDDLIVVGQLDSQRTAWQTCWAMCWIWPRVYGRKLLAFKKSKVLRESSSNEMQT